MLAVLADRDLDDVAELDVVGHRVGWPLRGFAHAEGDRGVVVEDGAAPAAGPEGRIGVSASTCASIGMIGPWAERL